MILRHLPRREFLRKGGATAAAAIACAGWAKADLESEVMTVTGPIGADQLGVTLPHEHVLVDFVGADKVSPERYDQNEAFEVIQQGRGEKTCSGILRRTFHRENPASQPRFDTSMMLEVSVETPVRCQSER